MSSIRPLVTITILVVVGAYLYVKINEGSLQPPSEASQSWEQTPEGVPPLASASAMPPTGETAAPAWNAEATTAPTSATTAATAEVAASPPEATPQQPAIPAIPEMPDLAGGVPGEVAATQPASPLTQNVAPPAELPASIPEARYPDQAATDLAAGPPTLPDSATPTSAVPDIVQSTVGAQTAPAQTAATTPEEMNAASTPAVAATTPLASQPNPLRQSPAAAPDAGRYGAATAPPIADNNVTTSSPTEPSFVESWPAIQAMLQRGELTEAHQQLSRWYGDPSLTPTDAERVEALLSQLAGTVVYSTEHRLAPAHVVKQGETLEIIATQYSVPWQLLAKINGVAAPNQIRPGQELKVVRGPFNAVVDLTRNQLTLAVDGRYAGKFPVTTEPGKTVGEGEWVVQNKQVTASERAIVLQGEAATPGHAAPTLVIAGAPAVASSANGGATIHVSAKDAEELSDILSVGSRVVTRR
jgi:LysM repeat protein